MNLTVLLISAYLPLPILIFMILRSGAFGKGSIGTLLKLFFLGVAAAVPAFLMEAACLLVVRILLGLFPEDAFGGHLQLVCAIIRYFIAVAMIEEGWKHFVLRTSTWKQMIMEKITDGVAASALVGCGFSAVMYGAWTAAFYVVPADMEVLRDTMPDFLGAGAVTAFLFALTYILSHFGYSGLMGAFYGIAKNSEQKEHGRRAGFMLFVSYLLPFLLHGFFAALSGYGVAADKMYWVLIGLALEVILALLMISMLSRASDTVNEDAFSGREDHPVDFADSEEFASFAEAAGNADDAENDSGENAEVLTEEDPGRDAEAFAGNDFGGGAEALAEKDPGDDAEALAEKDPEGDADASVEKEIEYDIGTPAE